MKEKSDVFMLVEKYREEQKSLLLKEIFEKCLYEELSFDEYEKLYEIPNKALKMLIISKSPRTLLVKIFLNENDEDIIELFEIEKFKKYADELLNAQNWRIRINAVEYASVNKLLERLQIETNIRIMDEISGRLKDCKISEEEADKYINSSCLDVREYAALYASKDKLLERLTVEDELGVVKVILDRLDKYKITQEQADKFMDSDIWDVRWFAVKYASVNKLFEMLEYEDDEEIFIKILAKLKKYNLSEELADKLIYSESNLIRKYALKYASTDMLIERLKELQVEEFAEEILKKLEKRNLTEKQADKLIDVDNCRARLIAIKYASKDKLLERLIGEHDKNVISAILSVLENSNK